MLCEDLPDEQADGVTYVQVPSTETAVGPVATLFHGDPTSNLKLVGVTGTNGKTTIATLLYNMFRQLGHKCGLLSTVCNYIDGEAVAATHTTPDPIELNELLERMVTAGCEYVFMECSSHAIAQQRIGGLKFAGGMFTNLTRDHLDYHKTFENYRDAKKAFFDMLDKDAFAITNADDKNGLFMVQNTKAQVKTYSTRVRWPTSAPASSSATSRACTWRLTATRWACSSSASSTCRTCSASMAPPSCWASSPRTSSW